MIGFDSIGQGAIGELTGDADVIIFAPSAFSVTVTAAAPVVHGGASVSPPGTTVVVTSLAPSVRAGALVATPTAPAVTVTVPTAAVYISATVTAPAAPDVSVTTAVPLVGAGAIISAPVVTVTVTKAASFITAGKSISPATCNVVVTAPVAGISISATISPAACEINVTTAPPQIFGGNYIEASNTVTMVTPYGEIASTSIGQFAIGEGELSTRIVKRGILVIVSCEPPFITAGKSIMPPAANINVTSSRAEIDSRGRKLRLYAIAS